MTFNKGKILYTIREALKIHEFAEANPKKKQSSSYWKDVADSGAFPQRTCDSLREFFKVRLKDGNLDNFMRYALDNNLRYCHAFKEIPKVPKV